jgi:hypothetical protein
VIGSGSAKKEPRWPSFAAWLAIGAGFSFGVLSVDGVFLMPASVIAAILLVRRPNPGRGLPGFVDGLGIAPLVIAYLNRDGPGDICTTTAHSAVCSQQGSPWPWLAVGIILLAVGTVWFIVGPRKGEGAAIATR